MLEKLRPSETPFGKEWLMYGQLPGLKTEDLIALQHFGLREVQVLPGISIGASYFFDYLTHNNLGGEIKSSQAKSGEIPDELRASNTKILEMIPARRPVIVRSSGLREHGGSGIYSSVFFIPSGNLAEDRERLASAEKTVYASFFSEMAKLYRGKKEPADGMGILIQPVVGTEFNEHFLPAFSGVVTNVNGQSILRAAMGLGTKVVDIDDEVGVFNVDDFDPKRLFWARHLDAINIKTGEVEAVEIDEYLFDRLKEQKTKVKSVCDAYRQAEKRGEQYYWEFAVSESFKRPFIVQSSLEQTPKFTQLESSPTEGAILCESNDVANAGILRGRGIIAIGWDVFETPSERDLELLAEFNNTHQDYLLIVPDVTLSSVPSLKRCQVNLTHFSNAAAIVELQFDREPFDLTYVNHTYGKGGSHFLELCRKKQILFLGVPIKGEDSNTFTEVLGQADSFGQCSCYWDYDFKVSNLRKKGRVEIIT